MTRSRGLAPFLSDAPGAVDLAARAQTATQLPGGGVELTVATRRVRPEQRDWYGTRAESTLHPAEDGAPARVRLELVAERTLRLRYAGAGRAFDEGDSAMLVPPTEPSPVSTWDAETGTLQGGGLRVVVAGDPLSVRVHDAAGRLLWATRPVDIPELEEGQQPAWRWLFLNRYAYPLGTAGAGAFLTWDLHHDERLHGLGEGFGPIDKRFAEHELWVREGYSNATPGSYKQVPFVWSTRGWGLFAHSSNAMRFDLGAREHASASLHVEDTGALDLFLVAGDTPAALLERYGNLTGRPRVPPRWSFGFWQGRITYHSQAEVEETAAELRRRALPCDVLHIDTGWFAQEWICDWAFDAERFPDPAGMCARLREQGFRVCVWQWPYVVRDTERFAQARDAGALVLGADGQPALLAGEWGDAAVIDVTSEAGRAWYAGVLGDVLQLGVSAIKADFGEGADPAGIYGGLPSPAAHNAYPLLYNRLVHETTESVVGAEEAVIWARSAWAGSQRYPLHWSGDGVARFADLPCVLRAMLSFGMSGFAFYAHDIGGFSGVPTPELYVRWLQLGIFSSHLRAHGTPPREPWAFGPEAEERARELLGLRMRLLPYLYSEAVACAADNQPVARALVLEYPDDPTAAAVEDAYLFGRAILVAPILDDGDERRVYLPAGEWIDFWTDERLEGGRWITARAGLDRIPLWVRAGSLLPLGPVLQHTGEASALPLELHVFGLREGEADYDLHGEDGPATLRVRRTADGALELDADAAAGDVVLRERG